MKRILLPLLTGTLLGAVGVLFWHQAATAATEAALKSESDLKIAQMQRDLTKARNEATTWQQRLESAGLDQNPVKENVLDIQRILNDARPLMKTLALMFGERRKEMTERMIRGMASKLAEQMGLTEAQTEAMIAHSGSRLDMGEALAGPSAAIAVPVSMRGSPSAMRHHRLKRTPRQVLAHLFERLAQDRAVAVGDSHERFFDHLVGERAELGQQRLRLSGEEQAPGTAIGGIGATLDQVGLLQAIDHPAHGDRLNLEQVGQPALVHALVAAQHGQDLPLRPGDPDIARARIEFAAHQARHVGQDRGEVLIHSRTIYNNAYICQDL